MATYFKRVLFISLATMLFEAISNSDLGIITQLASQNGNEWVGPVSISMIFLGSGLGSLYNKYIGRYPYKYVMFGGTMGWNIYLSFSVMFLFIGFSNALNAVILIGSFVCGLIMSFFYIGVNNYVNECGKIDNKIGAYFGINICIVQISNIAGNGLSAVLI
jgi:MFS family permease